MCAAFFVAVPPTDAVPTVGRGPPRHSARDSAHVPVDFPPIVVPQRSPAFSSRRAGTWHGCCDIWTERDTNPMLNHPQQTFLSRRTEMTSLTIKDLSSAETLDASKMHAVSGGIAVYPITSIYSPVKLSFDNITKITQSNQQLQDVASYFGNGSAFQDHMKNDVDTTQRATNNA
jgi:hypothetical protein